MMSRKIKEADLDCELRYIATLQETVETGKCEVTVLDCKTDRYLGDKSLSKFGIKRTYTNVKDAMTAVSELSTSYNDVLTCEDMFEIFGYHMYQLCVNRICA